MDFMNRSAGQPAAPARPAAANTGASASGGKRGSRWQESPMWLRVLWIFLLFSVTILIAALVALMYFGGPNEAKQIDKDRHQAVFLTNGQVYFGDLKSVNKDFLDLREIYYLNVNQQVQPNQETSQAQSSISLVKLGCELHGPVDQMIVNRDQVTFWENLKDDSQVSKAIAEWVKQNPNGQKCQTAPANSDANKP